MQEKLRELRTKNDPFWAELTCADARHKCPETETIVVEDLIPDPDDEEELDDSDVSLHDVIAATHQTPQAVHKRHGRASVRENGGLETTTNAEQMDEAPRPMEGGEGEGRGKRKKVANRQFADFSRHWDQDTSDIE